MSVFRFELAHRDEGETKLIGSILVQPQKVRRAEGASADLALVNDALNLSTWLLDPEHGEVLGGAFIAGLETAVSRMVQRTSGGLGTARLRLQKWLTPLSDFLKSQNEGGTENNDSGATPELAQKLLQALCDVAGNLTLDQLRGHIGELLDIIEKDLGVTPDFMEEQIGALLNDIVVHLEQVRPETSTEDRENRLGAAALLRRMKQRIEEDFSFPKLNVDDIARDLLNLLEKSGINGIARKSQCVTKGMGDVVDAGASLADLVLSGSKTVNAQPSNAIPKSRAALLMSSSYSPVERAMDAGALNAGTSPEKDTPDKSKYLWYATWLLESKFSDIPLLEKCDIKNAIQLATKLKKGSDEVSKFLLAKFSDKAKQLLQNYQASAPVEDSLLMAILDELNLLLQEPVFIGQKDFPKNKISLSEDTQKQLQTYEEDQELILANRMILEDIYPQEVNSLVRGLGGKLCNSILEVVKSTEQVRIDADGKCLRLGEKLLYRSKDGKDIDWEKAPIFSPSPWFDGQRYYSFENISAKGMEDWAKHSSWIVDALVSIWHLGLMQPGHRTTGILQSLHDLGQGITKLIAKEPLPALVSNGLLQWVLRQGIVIVITFGASWEGKHEKAIDSSIFLFWVTVFLADIISLITPISTLNTIRDVLLSSLTLINFGGPKDAPSTLPEQPADNHNNIDAFVGAAAFLWVWVLVKAIHREDYGNPLGFFRGGDQDRPWGTWLGIWLGGGIGMGILAGFTGTLLAEIIAWAEDWGLLLKGFGKGIGKVLLQFWPMFYAFKEGDTDTGKFNPVAHEFSGYPTRTSSPYFLPYSEGTAMFCGQANQGMWSHNTIETPSPATAQTYAYDFALDAGDEVLASRPGTVVAFFEGTQNDEGGPWNFIRIRHDVDDNDNPITPDPEHDREAHGRFTYAEYGHGRQNGITDAFALWASPVLTANIIGTRVRRGQPIMLAGNTGTSFHNHLHMHVLPEDQNTGQPANYTIPFVFQDVEVVSEFFQGPDGVCQHLKWYTSQNTRRT